MCVGVVVTDCDSDYLVIKNTTRNVYDYFKMPVEYLSCCMSDRFTSVNRSIKIIM